MTTFRWLLVAAIAMTGMAAATEHNEQTLRDDLLTRLFVRLEIAQRNIQLLREQLDTVSHQNESLQRRLQEVTVEFDGRLALLEGKSPELSSDEMNRRYAVSVESPPALLINPDSPASTRYAQAVDTLLHADFARAAVLLREYIDEADANDALLENAHFWLGEALYYAGDFTAAATQLQLFRAKFPLSDRAFTVGLRLIDTLIALEQLDQARDLAIMLEHEATGDRDRQRLERKQQQLN